jgi:hypothetical protein
VDRQDVTRISIELVGRGEPITGTADDGRGPRPFVGWLALIRILEDALPDDETPAAG